MLIFKIPKVSRFKPLQNPRDWGHLLSVLRIKSASWMKSLAVLGKIALDFLGLILSLHHHGNGLARLWSGPQFVLAVTVEEWEHIQTICFRWLVGLFVHCLTCQLHYTSQPTPHRLVLLRRQNNLFTFPKCKKELCLYFIYGWKIVMVAGWCTSLCD